MRLFVDSSVIVAATLVGHREGDRCRQSLLRVRRGEAEGWVAAHALAEAYSTLTGMPTRPKMRPAVVWRALEQNVLRDFRVVSLEPDDYAQVLADLAVRDVSGGPTYDALILRCAEKVEAQEIHTLNVRHFRRVRPDLAGRIREP